MELEHEESAAEACRRHESGLAVAVGECCDASGWAPGMSVVIPTQSVRLGWAGAIGLCVGVVLTIRTGLLSALPSAIGLTVLAASDLETRRIPREIVAATALSAAGLGVVDAGRLGSVEPFLRATAFSALVGLVAALFWFASSGIAFGDVKLLTLAAFVPAWLRGSAVITMVFVALMAAAVLVVVERIRLGSLALKSTIPFGPPLLIGWLVGVWVA